LRKALGQACSPTGLLGRVDRSTRRLAWSAAFPTEPPGLAAQPLPTDRAKPSGAYALAEQLDNANAAAKELGTTWLSLRKAFTRHRLGMPARNPHQSNAT